MIKRILVALLLLPVLVVVLYVAPAWVLPLVIIAASALCLFEFLMAYEKRITAACAKDLLLAVFLVLCVQLNLSLVVALGGCFLFALLLFADALSGYPEKKPSALFVHLFAATVIPLALSSLTYIYRLPIGRELILLPFIAAFGTDIFALFAGMLFGRHKLAPDISPKKTVEGAVGGLLGAVALAAVYLWVMPLITSQDIHLSGPLMLCIVAASSLTAQMGDLTFSLCKREFGVKDYGKILPGHGGMLDRLDSLILAAPTFAMLYLALPFAAELVPNVAELVS